MTSNCEKLFPGVYLLKCVVGNRPLSLSLLVGTKHVLLLDSGCSTDVAKVILPAFRGLNLTPDRLSFIVTSHSDFDHIGGNHALKAWAPQALLCCGEADRHFVENPDELYGGRYDCYRNDHGIFYPPEVEAWIKGASGVPQPIDLTLRGGEKIVLSPDWELEVLALPGHSPGHLGLLDRKNNALYAADALHGAVYRNLDGQAALCPTYANIPTYLQTIRFIEGLNLECYVGCHWPVKYGQEIDDFCEEAREFVLRAEALILRLLTETRTLRELCLLLGPSLGEWPRETDQDLVYAVWGHLCDLIERGLVQELPPSAGQPRASYVLSPKADQAN